MFVHYRTHGLIFQKDDYGEADQLFTVYTKDFGRLEILGKAVRKISSKLRAGADIFYLSGVEFIQGKTNKILTDAIPIEKFENIRKDLEKLNIAYKISEVLDNLIKGQELDIKIWQLLTETFEKLNNWKIENSLEIENQSTQASLSARPSTKDFLLCSGWKLEIIHYFFLWNLLSLLGYKPELYHCVLCQKNLSTYYKYMLDRAQSNLCSGLAPEKLYFNPKEGGIICQNCFKKVKLSRLSRTLQNKNWEVRELGMDTVKILRIILKKNWSILSRLKIEKSHLNSLKAISEICEGNLSLS